MSGFFLPSSRSWRSCGSPVLSVRSPQLCKSLNHYAKKVLVLVELRYNWVLFDEFIVYDQCQFDQKWLPKAPVSMHDMIFAMRRLTCAVKRAC